MDYSLAALKLLCSQLKDAKETTTQKSNTAFTLEGILFQRAWLQGILVSTRNADPSGRFLLDDGTGVIELLLSGDFLNLSLEECILWLLEGILSVKAASPLLRSTKLLIFLHFLIEKQCGT
ncbi:PREDICTED: uncharacterized protein LOC109242615 isoform X3 [Nicotiana attenuata]|uniref:uncharacterized protein LOC109242615 isoform X3 n=1 Tax=Nicotiana attenuata TaxID=49451 RepID=UPI000905AEFC|nr:PREDICTED: uncharacterized protein LOC109242615 isoform X3 [Nicotiana attenuata]